MKLANQQYFHSRIKRIFQIWKWFQLVKMRKINKARKAFQSYIRERDKGKPCISCGTTTATKWDAGHYLKAELYTGLIFNEDNVHRQCQRCNQLRPGPSMECHLEGNAPWRVVVAARGLQTWINLRCENRSSQHFRRRGCHHRRRQPQRQSQWVPSCAPRYSCPKTEPSVH